jgi:hypothetical protein
MGTAVRLAAMASLSTLGLGCGSVKDKPPLVDEESISWQVGCASPACSGFMRHSALLDEDEDVDIKVSCNKSKTSIDFTITIGEVKERGIPASTLRVVGADPTRNSCKVTIQERKEPGTGEFVLEDTCLGNNQMGGCTVLGNFDVDGWDFVGSLTCTKLEQRGDPTLTYKLVKPGTASDPIQIALDNCD